MRRFLKILIAVFIIIFLISLAMLIFEACQAQKDIEKFERILLLASAPLKEETQETEAAEELTEALKEAIPPKINLEVLKKENRDCVAWIYIEDTSINYPVMHTPDEKEKYLYKNFYGDKSKSGTPFIDSRCTLESDNIIIYAHNMMNGTMFADLKKYLDKSFLDGHKEIVFYTEEGIKEYIIFAVVKGSLEDNWYSFVNNADNSLIEEIKNKSIYNTKVNADESSRFLTLSTCYGREDDGRLLVVAIEKSLE